MENIYNDIDIFYQINSYNEIEKDKINNIKNNPYFLIESKNINRDKLSFEFLELLLVNDGVDLSQIKEFKYLIEEKEKRNNKTHILLQPLSDTNISEIKYLNKIYLHLLVEEETETPNDDYINEEMEEYNLKIEKYEMKLKEISMGIEKEKIYNDKILSENLFKNIEKNNFSKEINNEVKYNKTMIRKTLPPISNSFIISNIEDEYYDNENNLIKEINNDLINNNIDDNNIRNAATNTILVKKVSLDIDKKEKEKEEIKLCYLYSDPLLYKDNKTIYKNNDYFNEIVSIYNIFKELKIKSNLKFEPIINNFNTYLESSPDILHINVCSTNDTSLQIDYDNLGELQYYKCKDLKTAFKSECSLSEIKLLILSTQNIKEMKQFFNNIGIKNIIYIDNKKTYPEPNEQVENFIKELYKNILNGKSIQESFKKSKGKFNDKKIVDIFTPSKKRNDYIILNEDNKINKYDYNKFYSQKFSNIKINNKNLIKLNKNCSLNLNFVKYNYKRIIGRNVELKNCIDKMYRYNNVCVCGYPGAGKKSFVQLAGKFAFERNMYQDVYYLEVYSLRNVDEILMNKKNEIKENMKLLDNNQIENDEKKILLIINFNYLVDEVIDIPIFEELINGIKDKYFNYLYTFTINNKLSFSTIKKKLLRTPLIELNKLEKEKRRNLFTFISYNLKNINLTNKKEEELVNTTNGYPNDIYLRTLYVNCFYEEINNLDFNKLTNELIFNNFIKKYDKKIKKIFATFTILKLGIREDVLPMFFDKEEINFIKKELNYLIFEEIDENGKNYLLDSSYKDLIQNIFSEQYSIEFSNYLNLILKNYAIIFRYLVKYTNYPYNIALEFHAGINRGFWLIINESKYNEKFMKEYNSYKKKDIYFDEVKYFNNVLMILINDEYIKKIKENKEPFIEYISQISICLPTLFHFQNSKIYEKRIVELLKERLGFLNLNKSRLRLKMYQYWFTKDSNLVPNDSEIESNIIKDKINKETKRLNNELKAEVYLIKIHDYILKKDKENLGISDIYNECENHSQDNKFNLSKLNLLYGMALKNNNNKEYFEKAYNYALEDKNIYMQIMSLIMKAEYYLSKYEFDRFNELITQCEKEIILKEIYLQNTDINYRLNKAIKDKNEIYKKHTKNRLFFFTSNPFFDEKGNSLKTESNNSFYLKYNLITELPKNLKIEFNNIEENFLNDLEKCLYNPIRFLYIGSDHYNEEGNLFYTKDFKSCRFNSKLIKEKLEKAKNKCDIVILGFLNSEKISEYFLVNKFPHVIYIKKVKQLNILFNNYPYLYFYFQRCFYTFITEFLSNLSKKYCAIKEAFTKANSVFEIKCSKMADFIIDKNKNKINDIFCKILILGGDEKRDNEVFFEDFEDLNNQGYNNSSSSLLNMINIDSKSSFESNFSNNSFLQNNSISSFYDEEKKQISKAKEKKNMVFFKFPKGELKDEIFEKLYNNRIYGMKKILKNLINKILNNKIINLYGDYSCGKTRICLELCKYFYMNNKFKQGIFYINLKRKRQIQSKSELKSLLIKNNSKNKDIETNDALLIFDNFDSTKKGLYSYINKLNSYTVIVTKEKETKFFENLNNNKNNIKNNINNDIFENLNKTIDIDFAKEFINYMKIIKNINENIMIDEDEIYITTIIDKINGIEENINKKKNYLSSSQLKIKI